MKWFSCALIVLLVSGCQRNHYDMNDIYAKYGNGSENTAAYIEKAAALKVYFGHQSVGFNIIDGIEKWEAETGVQIAIVETKDLSSGADASLVHFRVGKNQNPLSKVDEFVSLVGQIPNEGNPVAFFKFCYVDFTSKTDVDEVYAHYKKKMLYLMESYPYIRFAASTVPYMGKQRGAKALAKKVLGRASSAYLDNKKREDFNKKLIADFKGVLPIFDLGGIEATLPDGTPVTYTQDGKVFPLMPNIYTYDMGHLTEHGARTLGYNLLAFLAGEFN